MTAYRAPVPPSNCPSSLRVHRRDAGSVWRLLRLLPTPLCSSSPWIDGIAVVSRLVSSSVAQIVTLIVVKEYPLGRQSADSSTCNIYCAVTVIERSLFVALVRLSCLSRLRSHAFLGRPRIANVTLIYFRLTHNNNTIAASEEPQHLTLPPQL